jgi:hypothetical protein
MPLIRFLTMEPDTDSSPFADIFRQGLQCANDVFDQQEFAFVINGQTVDTSLFEAVMLSPFAYEAFESDRSCNQFTISSDAASASAFSLLRRIAGGAEVTPDASSSRSAIALARALGDRSLELASLALFLGSEPDAASPLMGRVPLEEICAQSFEQCSFDDLLALGVGTLDGILGSESLVISSEDSLLGTLLDLATQPIGRF